MVPQGGEPTRNTAYGQARAYRLREHSRELRHVGWKRCEICIVYVWEDQSHRKQREAMGILTGGVIE